MVKFTKMRVENFYSLEDVTLDFKTGIVKVEGRNLDRENNTEAASNGSGKSSLLVALHQGLYNKNLKNRKANIDDTYNKTTKKPYRIEVWFIKDTTEYRVVNDRGRNNIQIFENEVDISLKKTADKLKQIENIIGLDFDTFSALTFLSQHTVSSVFQLTNENNILYKFFDVDKIKTVDKGLKAELKELKQEKVVLLSLIGSITKSIDLLTGFKKVDVDALHRSKTTLLESLLDLEKGNSKIGTIQRIVDEVTTEKQNIYSEKVTANAELNTLKNTLEELKSGVCPTCGSHVENVTDKLEESVAEAEQKFAKSCEALNVVNKKLEAHNSVLLKEKRELDGKKSEITKEINAIDGKILVVAQQEEEYEAIQANAERLEDEKTEHIHNIHTVNMRISFITSAIAVIKSGALTREYINRFVKILNLKVKEYSVLTELPFIVRAKEDGGKLNYTFLNASREFINFDDLSSGEKTRASLVVLLATVATLETLTGISVNYIVFDELLSVLDEDGLSVFKRLLNEYRADKSVFVVLHHDEIEETFFDSVTTINKRGGISWKE